MTYKTWEEMSYKEQLAAEHYDFYKSVYGIRPRWMDYDAMTEEQLEAELKFLGEESERVCAEEEAAQKEAIVRFERRVLDVIESGAQDRETAIRWIRDAEGAEYADMDYLCYCLGLPYGYFKETV